MNNIRKFAIAALFCFISATGAKAQIILGGSIGFTPGRDGTGIGINLAPEIGYSFNDKIAAGGYISYQSRYNSFGITPYARWHFVGIGNRVRLFLCATAPMRFSSGYQSYGLNVRPGLTIRIADNVGIMAHIGTFGYNWEVSNNQMNSYWLARVNGDNISIGFCVGI